MEATRDVIHEIPGLYQVVRFIPLRRTESVAFDLFPIRAIDLSLLKTPSGRESTTRQHEPFSLSEPMVRSGVW